MYKVQIQDLYLYSTSYQTCEVNPNATMEITEHKVIENGSGKPAGDRPRGPAREREPGTDVTVGGAFRPGQGLGGRAAVPCARRRGSDFERHSNDGKDRRVGPGISERPCLRPETSILAT